MENCCQWISGTLPALSQVSQVLPAVNLGAVNRGFTVDNNLICSIVVVFKVLKQSYNMCCVYLFFCHVVMF